MMIRHVFFALLLVFGQTSFAAASKCVAPDGKVAYQATPCSNASGQSQKVLSAPPPSSSQSTVSGQTKKKCPGTGKEMSIDFQSMPLFTTLKDIADASGNKLSFSPRIDVSGAFHYVCVPWDVILKDIAAKYNLSTKVEAGTIYVRPK
jgi:hypothetical protein